MEAPTAPSGDSLISSASQPGDPNPFVLLGTLLFALAAAAGGALRGDPSLFRKLTRGLHGAHHHGLKGTHGLDSTATRAAHEGLHHTSPGLTSFDTVGDLSPVTYPDVASANAAQGFPGGPSPAGSGPMAAGQPASSPGGNGGLGGNGGMEQLARGGSGGPNGLDSLAKGAPNSLDNLAKAAPNGVGPDGFSASHLSSADPGIAQHLGGQAADPGLGHHGSGLSDWHTGGSSASEAVAQGPSGDSLGGASGSDALAHGSGGSGDLLAHGTGGANPMSGHAGLTSSDAPGQLGGGHAAGLGGSDLGSSHGVAHSGLGSSGLGGSHGAGADGGALAHHGPAPSGDLASQSPTLGGADGLTQPDAASGPDLAPGQETVAHIVDTADSPLPVDFATLSAAETLDTSATVPGPSWLGIGALAKAGAPNPLPRIVACTICGRVVTNPSRFCGYCGEPFDKTLV